jgi:hypothetical protein
LVVVDLAVYPGNIFNFLLVIGLLLIRRRRSKLNLPRPEYRAWSIAIGFALLANLYMLAAPWYPPATGANGGDVSFWYGTYLVVGIGLYVIFLFVDLFDFTDVGNRLVGCGIYYFLWIKWIPKWKGYVFRQTVLEFEDGSVAHKLVKVPVVEVSRWDEEHDAVGRLRHRTPRQSGTEVEQK